MPTHLNPNFNHYLDQLPIKPSTRNNYRQYVRWIEAYASGTVDLQTMKTDADVNRLIDAVAKGYNETHPTGHRFNAFRRADTKCILNHYMNFLSSHGVRRAQEDLDRVGEFEIANYEEGKEKVWCNIARRRGQPAFRDDLLEVYGARCAITGTSLTEVLEAAHISPYNGPSTNHIRNGLLLRSDIHDLFDLGLLSIDPDTFRIHCSEAIQQEPTYQHLHGQRLRVPSKVSQYPSSDALRTHFENRVP